MKSVWVTEPFKVEVKDIEKPSVGDYDVLIKVKAAGICGSDIHTYKGLHPFRKPPVVIGHELAGEVVEIGSMVSQFKIGDRVTVEPQISCGKCDECLTGKTNHCSNRDVPGVNGWLGAMAEYFVTHEKTVFTLPEEMSFEVGVLAEPLSVGIHAVRKGNVKLGDKVAVLGSGPIGLLAVAAAKAAGAHVIAATDTLEYPLEKATELGATHTFNALKANWITGARNIVPEGFDCVIVAIGVKGIINQSLSLLKKGGRSIAVAMFNDEEPLDIMQLQSLEKEVIGSFTYTREDTVGAISLLQKEPSISSVVSHVLDANQADYGFTIVAKKQDQSNKVIVTFD